MLDITKPDSSKNIFRAKRIGKLRIIIDDYIKAKGCCTVIDIGGTSGFWYAWKDKFDFTRTHITCVNISTSHSAVNFDGVTVRHGDATNLSFLKDKSFDVAFSNSVIEHVGLWIQQEKFAAEAKRIARSYLIQTPNFFFPIEPHARTPILHWLPDPIAYRVVMARKCGFYQKASTISQAMRTIQDARMLGPAQFRALFSDANVHYHERFLGLTKSLIAIRHSTPLSD